MATSPQRLSLLYYHQFNVPFSYASGDKVQTPPSISYVQFGGPLATTPGTSVWADSGSAFSFQNPLSGSTATERWFSPNPSGTISSSTGVSATYFHQLSVTVTYTVLNGGSPGSPVLTARVFGSQADLSLSTSPSTQWLDAGGSWMVNNPLPGSTSTERWFTTSSTSGTVSGAASISIGYYHQFLVTASYQLVGGGLPGAPVLSSTFAGSSVSAPITTSATSVWYDAGSAFSVTNPLPKSGSTERWISSTPNSGNVGASMTLQPAYHHQYLLSDRGTPAEGGSVSNSTGWYYSGVSVRIQASARPGWRFEGWTGNGGGSYSGSDNDTAVTVAAAINETATFYPGLAIEVTSGGSVAFSFGSTTGTIINSGVEYAPKGTSISLSASPSSFFESFQGWSGAVTGGSLDATLSLAAPAEVKATFGTNYIVILGVIGAVAAVAAAVVAIRRRK
jgi:hypothetical protein